MKMIDIDAIAIAGWSEFTITTENLALALTRISDAGFAELKRELPKLSEANARNRIIDVLGDCRVPFTLDFKATKEVQP